MSVKNKAEILAFIGASGSGKSTSMKRELKRAKAARLLVWDPLREYGEFGQVFDSLVELIEAMQTGGKVRQRFALVYQPPADKDRASKAFSTLCQAALTAGNCTLLIEELALVTTPSWAPPGWREACLTGRHRGLRIMAASQRPASVDKDFFGNATRIRCGRLNQESDIRVMCNVLSVPRQQVAELLPLQYIERDMATGATGTGRITF